MEGGLGLHRHRRRKIFYADCSICYLDCCVNRRKLLKTMHTEELRVFTIDK